MKITVSFLGGLDRLADIGEKEVVKLPDNSTIRDLINKFGISEKNARFFIVNGNSQNLNYTLKDGDQIRIFPLMGGG